MLCCAVLPPLQVAIKVYASLAEFFGEHDFYATQFTVGSLGCVVVQYAAGALAVQGHGTGCAACPAWRPTPQHSSRLAPTSGHPRQSKGNLPKWGQKEEMEQQPIAELDAQGPCWPQCT